MSKGTKVLIIGKVWPEPTSSAAGSRMLQLIQLFKSKGWDISFSTTAGESDFSIDLDELGVLVSPIKLNDSSFDEFIKILNPDIVLFDRFMTEEQFGWRVAEYCPSALRVLDTEDLHCLRAGRYKAHKEGRDFQLDDLFTDYAKREIASIYRCDLSLIISEFEIGLLKTIFKIDSQLLYHFPFLLGPISDTEIKKWISFEERKDFISMGNFLHEPNWDSVLYLKQTIWPSIRTKIPEAKLYIYGAYPSQKVFQLNDLSEGFIVKGRAESALQVMEGSRICLAPLRFGAGLKGKLIDAMKSGTPSITTKIGSESMHGKLDWAGCIQDDPKDFVSSAVEQYSNKDKWQKSQENGVKIINQIFAVKDRGEQLISKIEGTMDALLEHRRQNFVGSMLEYHTLASTKFMSKWIEEKNKI